MLLSVIIPVYNTEKYIDECFSSILRQGPLDAELICVDDGSTDGSGALLDEYAGKYNCFRVYHQAHAGIGAARNTGLREARGRYVAWIDPDDYIAPDWGVRIVEALRSHEPDILLFDYCFVKAGKAEARCYGREPGFLDVRQFLYDVAGDQRIQSQLWQKVCKRELFTGLAFPENVKCMEDYAILHKLIERAQRVFYLKRPLYCYRKRDDGLVMQVDLEKSWQCFEIAKARYEHLSPRYPGLSRMGYLTQALGFCIQYEKCEDAAEKRRYGARRRAANELLDKALLYALRDHTIGHRVRLIFLLRHLGLLGAAWRIKRLLKGKA